MIPILKDSDFKEMAKRERYKLIELERRERIFNAKKRQIGVDYNALQTQILEKKEREKAEQLEDTKYLEKQKFDASVIHHLDKKHNDDRRRVQQKINEYRKLHQRFEDRREFDLNDPNRFKKDKTALSPDDPPPGVSSMQFEGKEEESALRKKILAEQQQTWLLQQILEKENNKRELKEADSIYEATTRAQVDRFIAMKKLEEECKHKLNVATMEYNKALAVKKLRTEIEDMKIDIEDKHIHKINQITSSFLSETQDSSSTLGPGRINTTTFKGMTEKQRAKFKEAQLLQIEEKQAKKREKEMEQKYYEQYQQYVHSKIASQNALQERTMVERGNAIRDENKQLSEDQKAKHRYLNEYVYTNTPTAEYFAQFNTTTR